MVKTRTATTSGWREARRQSARDAIVDAAWDLVHEEGLAGLSLRDLAGRAGITTPTLYAYFDSKHAIYDAMFGRAATEFADWIAAPLESSEPAVVLVAAAAVTLTGFLLARRELPEPRPGLWPMRFMLIHDTVHVLPQAERS